MKKKYFLFFLFTNLFCFSQSYDVIAIQDFETAPSSPTWNFTGPVVYNSGTSSSSAAPANSPIGINNSRAWETTAVSAGLTLEFENITLPSGYDSFLFEFKLAAMNLLGTTGGPDNLDYIQVEYSTDNGQTYIQRLRIRGATNNNSFWEYSATGVGIVDYLPETEAEFYPTDTGLATTEGYSTNGITFPGTISQLKIRITARSSSSSDTWLIDNVTLKGITTLSSNDFETNAKTSRLFPNPTSGILNIDSDSIIEYSVYDILGNTIISGNSNTIDLSDKPKGMYFVTIQSDNSKTTHKIIKQ
ncbi:T9SS type A sorting domain-containing protein [Flavobacterium sp. TP390]|uniref:T9SS type A sorting domain-containing protein n=1 Tax=Flavobacterium profundi TaxID=1774945 RepID=A0A6I4IVM4_9FLAO|nr:T9SS type A sorting domain-containing protein [Flavobacterium profundi]MVO10855.1 T9SS type A sorting domain-containing protein [Flavobacterium profundi]